VQVGVYDLKPRSSIEAVVAPSSSSTPVVEHIALSRALDPYLTLKALAGYAGMSVRKLRDLIGEPFYPVPHYRVGGKILVRVSEFDVWIKQHRVTAADIDRMVRADVSELKRAAGERVP
jgi:hypothetical protein